MSIITKYITEDKLNYKPTFLSPKCLAELYGEQYIDKQDLERMIKLEEEAEAKKPRDGVLIADPTITEAERTQRRFMSHKPDYCGSCFHEQRYDHGKYCHHCQRDPHYNPDNLPIGSGSKSIQDYNPVKESIARAHDYALGCQGVGMREQIQLGTVLTDWEEFQLYKEFLKMKMKSK